MSKCDQFKDHASSFMKPNQSHEDIIKHVQCHMEVLYNCKPGKSLDFERAARFSSRVASRSVYLPPESLPHVKRECTFWYRPGWEIVWIQLSGAGFYTKPRMGRD